MSAYVRGLLLAVLVFGTAHAQGTQLSFGGGNRNPDAQVEVISDSLSLDRETGNATFSGDVVIVQGDMRMAAAQVVVFYSQGSGATSQQIDRMEATGGVTFTMGPDAAEAQQAVYDPATRQVVLSGDVLVTQGAATIAGQRLTVNLDTGTGTVEGRVRTVLQPGPTP